MCGRFTLAVPAGELVQLFEVGRSVLSVFEPRYNIAPTQDAPVVVGDAEGGRHLGLLRWGLIPSWADDPGVGGRLINARSETAATKPSFRTAFARRRCLVPVDGFYEWRKTPGAPSTPFHIHRPDRGVMALAGIWERWRGPAGEVVSTFAILTRDADSWMAQIHHRMPVVLDPSSWTSWLGPDTPAAAVSALVAGGAQPSLEAWEVDRRVNAPVHDDPACAEPLAGGEAIPQGSGRNTDL